MELKTELTLVDKLKSWKRWAGVVAFVAPILLQAVTAAIGWPVAIITAVLGAVALILGLAQEDAARLKAVGLVLVAAITNEEYEEIKEDDDDPYDDDPDDDPDDEEWEDEDEDEE